MSAKWWLSFFLAAALVAPASALARPPQHDYLTHGEANKIRNANSSNDRIKLFLDFAQDRLDRFQRELKMPGAGPRWADFLNDILDSFDSCVNEATKRIHGAIRNGHDVHSAIKDAKKRLPEFEKELEKIEAANNHLSLYKETLSDTLSDLRYDLKSVKKAGQQLQLNPPPRPPQGGGRR